MRTNFYKNAHLVQCYVDQINLILQEAASQNSQKNIFERPYLNFFLQNIHLNTQVVNTTFEKLFYLRNCFNIAKL